MYRLNENDRWALINALHSAADQMAEFAKVQAQVAVNIREGHTVALFAKGEPGARAADTLAQQFRDQREGYLNYARMIEEAEYVEFGDPEVLTGEG